MNITVQDMVALLNEMYELDPEATAALVNHRVPCNDKIADHPTIQCGRVNDQGQVVVGLLGFLNGLIKEKDNKVGVISDGDDITKIVRFSVVKDDEFTILDYELKEITKPGLT